ncbi:uncharacterized protein LOC120694569 isoform X3 [Panicum virgatum]|uniref:uncharacterized protein LOC120694569 isoform X3 n=1 Tax=Panicum virgatum TaxID=38727 RepID=UPI0019D57F0D|nr:uncharacterized protein LOC120694569 isoform X3 [Panicum virgatum]
MLQGVCPLFLYIKSIVLHLEAARARPSTRSSAGNGDGAGDGVDLTKAVADEASFDHDGTTRCERGRLLRAVVGAWRRILQGRCARLPLMDPMCVCACCRTVECLTKQKEKALVKIVVRISRRNTDTSY